VASSAAPSPAGEAAASRPLLRFVALLPSKPGGRRVVPPPARGGAAGLAPIPPDRLGCPAEDRRAAPGAPRAGALGRAWADLPQRRLDLSLAVALSFGSTVNLFRLVGATAPGCLTHRASPRQPHRARRHTVFGRPCRLAPHPRHISDSGPRGPQIRRPLFGQCWTTYWNGGIMFARPTAGLATAGLRGSAKG
jgi:hypothetical protein